MSTFQVNCFKTKHKTSLSIAISMALSLPVAQADTFNVTEAQDNGTGLIANTLSWAIFQANTTVGEDVIELNTNVSITGVMKRLIDSDTTLQSDLTRRIIDGNNQFRPLFVKSGQVTIQNLDIENGLAKGGGSGDGGNGAGLGGLYLFMMGMLALFKPILQTHQLKVVVMVCLVEKVCLEVAHFMVAVVDFLQTLIMFQVVMAAMEIIGIMIHFLG